MFGLSRGAAGVSIALQWKLLDKIFVKTDPLHAIVQISVFVATVCACTRSPLALLWGAAALATVAGRSVLPHAYAERGERDAPDTWARRFTDVAAVTAVVQGSLGLLIVLVANPTVHMLVVAVQSSFLFTVVARNACLPAVASAQVLLVKLPLAIACFLTQDVVYVLLGIGTLVETATLHRRISVLHGQILRELETNEELTLAHDELEDANRQLAEMATTDALTGLGNRRGFDLAFRREWRRALREHLPLSLLLLDLDHFKLLNDALGHSAGDACLREVAQIIDATARRPSDVPTRYGGEEFAVVMPNTDVHAARFMAERMRAAIAARALAHPASRAGRMTASVGAATILPSDTTLPTLLIEQADSALYRAKASGRNCVCVFERPRPPERDAEREPGAKPAQEPSARSQRFGDPAAPARAPAAP